MNSRRVWKIDRAGSLNRLKLIEEILPPPLAGEARIQIHAVGLNFADIFACLGLYSATPEGEFTPGLEFAGVIEDINYSKKKKKELFKKGDRVMGVIRFGSYASRVNTDIRYIRPPAAE